MAFRFIHTGDLHLDSPFVGLSAEAPPNVAATLREATILAWRNIVELALTEEVDFLLVAGDAFEHANRTLRGQLAFRDGLARLADAGIRSFIVTGNHDPLDGWEPSVTWPQLSHRFPAKQVTAQPVERDGVEIARIYGISYHQRDITANLAKRFERDANAPFAIGLLHANVGGIEGAANYAPCSLADLRASGMDYWALGHIHAHRILSKKQPLAVYCGNPQGRDTGETDPRGCYLVTVDDSGHAKAKFKPMDVVRWQLIDVPIDALETEEALVDAVAVAVDAARTESGRSIVARVQLSGRGPLHESLAGRAIRDDVRSAAQERLGATEHFAWIEAVRDATRPALDVEARREADDFVGDLLRRLDATRRQLAGEPASEGPDAADVLDEAAIEATLDGLFADGRARRSLQDARPGAADVAGVLDEVEAILLDRLGDEA
jgi:DNA repair exonuclease SbcCD nuclease subunit